MNEARYREAERRLWQSVGVAPTEHRLLLGRTGVTVRVQEAGEGPAVVFVHGGSNAGSSWASLAARLEGFRCVLLDRPGCGLSDPLATRFDDVQQLAEFAGALVVDIFDAMGFDRAHVIATSFGGYFALHAAAAHPDRVGRVVELGWTLGAPVGRTPMAMRFASVPIVGRLLAAIPPNERAVRMILRQLGLGPAIENGRFSQEAIDWYLALLRDTRTMRNELDAGPRLVSPRHGMSDRVLLPASLLASIHTPLYFLWGEKDPVGGADIARQFVEHLPNAELEVMPGAGHAPWIDDLDHAAASTRAFLDR